jgi:hypothetical protein
VQAAPPPGRQKGTLGEQPYGTNVAKVYKSSHTRGTTEAAGTVVHEGEHVLQKLTPQKYRQHHEVEAFSKQVKADPRFLQILKDLYGKNLSAQDAIQAHVAKYYKQVPK